MCGPPQLTHLKLFMSQLLWLLVHLGHLQKLLLLVIILQLLVNTPQLSGKSKMLRNNKTY